MTLALTIWLCGGLPATVLALECRPRSLVEWLTAIGMVVFWPVCIFVFFVALLREEEQ